VCVVRVRVTSMHGLGCNTNDETLGGMGSCGEGGVVVKNEKRKRQVKKGKEKYYLARVQ
jgi:hypothetical protein